MCVRGPGIVFAVLYPRRLIFIALTCFFFQIDFLVSF